MSLYESNQEDPLMKSPCTDSLSNQWAVSFATVGLCIKEPTGDGCLIVSILIPV